MAQVDAIAETRRYGLIEAHCSENMSPRNIFSHLPLGADASYYLHAPDRISVFQKIPRIRRLRDYVERIELRRCACSSSSSSRRGESRHVTPPSM